MTPTSARHHDEPRWYEIRVQGHLDPRWAAWFDGLSLTCDSGGTTSIRGRLMDQAALYGVLQRVRDVGLPLLSLTQVEPAPDVPAAEPR
ncbi:hypothetical protein [Georgenia ruanii]|uniref:Uncharacterized protein n=1 Tax=Georgenia ruanii TaxID=348442 RepID=A0A7J9UZ83_9MICO|nr:hypothetical protein [Georgenia ruanii]MPV89951.1 hypothetical protein [Georgenia ruanii]